MDYYSILGVSRNATPEEIKKSYKKLASKHHPDKGGSEAEFKKLQEAYSILSDPSKKSQYDNPQEFNFNANSFNDFSNFQDIMGSVFGQGARRSRQRNQDIRVGARITLEDSFFGKGLVISYRLSNGSQESVSVDVPPGAKSGDTIRYSGLGDNTHPSFPRGDLHVVVQVDNHKEWIRDGDHIYVVKYVDVFDLLLGTAIIIKTLDNKDLKVTVPPGTAPGSKFSIKGYGMPNVNHRRRGNVFIQVETTIPKINNEEIRTKLREIKDAIS